MGFIQKDIIKKDGNPYAYSLDKKLWYNHIYSLNPHYKRTCKKRHGGKYNRVTNKKIKLFDRHVTCVMYFIHKWEFNND